MTAGHSGTSAAGLLGPVSVSAGLLLLLLAPLMRGGNRPAALVVLEAIGLVVLLCLWAHSLLEEPGSAAREPASTVARWILLLSPALLALVYLVPVPLEFWAGTPGRNLYPQTLRDAGVAMPERLPLSLVPDATLTSLLAGIPLVAAFALGRACTLPQLRLLARLVVVVAFGQVLLGLLQMSGGVQSPFYFGAGGGRPIGTFANSNHFANYLSAALMLYIWLGWESRAQAAVHRTHHTMALWVAGGVLLVLGVLMSQSRGGVLSGLPMAALGLGWLMHTGRRHLHNWQTTLMLIAAVLLGAVALLGLDAVLARFGSADLVSSASFRGVLTQTTLAGAAEFWPWGAGWGVYGDVYPRFQPPAIAGAAGFAHQDYAQMLFEGGVFSLVLVAAFCWLAASRAAALVRALRSKRGIGREAVVCVLCGLGLLGFLLHSLVEFNMHIPANAILASLLAGVYLRPLPDLASSNDRLAQPHPAGH